MKLNANRIEAAARWFEQQACALNRFYNREIKRRATPCHGHVRRTPFKSFEWCSAVSRASAAYRFAATTLRAMPLEPPELIRGPAPYGRAIRSMMDHRAFFIARAWDDLGHTKEAEAALRAAYDALWEFMRVE